MVARNPRVSLTKAIGGVWACLLAVAACGCAGHSTKPVAIRDVFIISQRAGEACASDRDVETTTGVPVVLHVVVRAEADGVERYYSSAGSVVLGGKSIQTAPWPRENGPLHISWFSIGPQLRPYRNFEDYVARIHHVERPLRGGWRLGVARRRGTYRFRVRVAGPGGSVSSPGLEQATRENLLPGVRRVSIRENRGDGDNIDFMTMFFNVAYVYGNRASEANNFIGIDCQDLCIYGLNRTGWDISYDVDLHDAYRSHIIFDAYYDPLGRTYNLDSERVSVPIRRGDIIHFATIGHYGAVYADRSLLGRPNGRLDAFDDIIQTMGLTYIGKLGWFGLGDWASSFRHLRNLLHPPLFRLRVLRFQNRS